MNPSEDSKSKVIVIDSDDTDTDDNALASTDLASIGTIDLGSIATVDINADVDVSEEEKRRTSALWSMYELSTGNNLRPRESPRLPDQFTQPDWEWETVNTAADLDLILGSRTVLAGDDKKNAQTTSAMRYQLTSPIHSGAFRSNVETWVSTVRDEGFFRALAPVYRKVRRDNSDAAFIEEQLHSRLFVSLFAPYEGTEPNEAHKDSICAMIEYLIIVLRLIGVCDVYRCVVRCLCAWSGMRQPFRNPTTGATRLARRTRDASDADRANTVLHLIHVTVKDLLAHEWFRYKRTTWLCLMQMQQREFLHLYHKWMPQVSDANLLERQIRGAARHLRTMFSNRTHSDHEIVAWCSDTICRMAFLFPETSRAGTTVISILMPISPPCIESHMSWRPSLFQYMIDDLQFASWSETAAELPAGFGFTDDRGRVHLAVDSLFALAVDDDTIVQKKQQNTKMDYAALSVYDLPSPLCVTWRRDLYRMLASVESLYPTDPQNIPALDLMFCQCSRAIHIRDLGVREQRFLVSVASDIPVVLVLFAISEDPDTLGKPELLSHRAVFLAHLMSNYRLGYTHEAHLIWNMQDVLYQLADEIVAVVKDIAPAWKEEARRYFHVDVSRMKRPNAVNMYDLFDGSISALFQIRHDWESFTWYYAHHSKDHKLGALDSMLIKMSDTFLHWKDRNLIESTLYDIHSNLISPPVSPDPEPNSEPDDDAQSRTQPAVDY